MPILLTGANYPAHFESQANVMKIVHKKTQKCLVEFKDGGAHFYDPILEKEMSHKGVYIPPFMRESFEGKTEVFPQDPLFQKAFLEVYCIFVLPQHEFEKQ